MSQNLISQTMTDTQRDALLAELDSFDTLFANYKCLLTPEQISRLSRLDAEEIGLLDSALTFATQNPGDLPASVNVAEFAKDVALAKQLVQVNAKTQQKANMTKCSVIAVMSDGFAVARAIYRVAKAQGRTPQNAAFLDAFGAFFDKPSRPAPPPTP